MKVKKNSVGILRRCEAFILFDGACVCLPHPGLIVGHLVGSWDDYWMNPFDAI
jgi:hypothetical protein